MSSASTTGTAKAAESAQPLSPEELRKVHAYWRAANYISVGQIYLYANPLLSGVVPSRTCSSRKVSAALPARATANPAACRPKLTAGVGASAGDRPPSCPS